MVLRDDQDEATNEPVKIKRLPPPAQISAKPLPTVEALVEEVVRVADQAVPVPIPDPDQKELDLLRFCAAPGARLSHLSFKSDGAFPSQC